MSLTARAASAYAAALAGADGGEVFLEDSSWTTASLEDGRIQEVNTGTRCGLGLRLLRRREGRVETWFGHAQDLDPEAALRLRARLLPPGGAAPAFGGHASFETPVLRDPASAPLSEKTALLAEADRVVRAEFPGVRQATFSYADRARGTRVLSVDGTDHRQLRRSVVFSASVVMEKDGLLQTGHETVGGARGLELLDYGRALAAARRAAARAAAKLRAPKAKAGEMPVVLAASAGGTFIHEAIGHSLEVDHVQEGSSPAYAGALGKVVAPPLITVIDDPTLPFQRGSYAFDDEGRAAAPTTLVKDGVLTDYLYDRACALRDGRPGNAHGRRESFAHRPIPRMSNLYIAPGPHDPAEIVAGLERGLLVTAMGGGQVDTATGEFVFEVDEGWWVEDGQVKHLVRDANLLGVGPQALASIDRVGWDIGWGVGTCGKDDQSVPVSDGQPTIRMPRLVVGGSHD
ncbi:MAG: TldD/PmbA family protein [Elusimicrobiota bacterium]|nr:TldD/PmbA family protein [Elusimicrobiota bacterium]